MLTAQTYTNREITDTFMSFGRVKAIVLFVFCMCEKFTLIKVYGNFSALMFFPLAQGNSGCVFFCTHGTPGDNVWTTKKGG